MWRPALLPHTIRQSPALFTHGSSVKVFRCQLPRINDFYSSDNPNRDGSDEPCCPGVALCNWCGTQKGDKICSGCKKVHYCSQKHQVMDWRSGQKAGCQQLNLSSQLLNSSSSDSGTTSVEISKAKLCGQSTR